MIKLFSEIHGFFFLTQHLICTVTIIKTWRKTRNAFIFSMSETRKQTSKFKGYWVKIPYPVTSASEILVNFKIIYQ